MERELNVLAIYKRTTFRPLRKQIGSMIVALLLSIPFFYSVDTHAQSACPNMGFEMGDFTGWEAFTGLYTDPINTLTPGFVVGRHTIMDTQGTDPNADNQVFFIAPGSNYSVRLGNDMSGRQLDRVTYDLTVSPDNFLFIFRYAVVMQNPGHSVTTQPVFEVSILDTAGNLIDPTCGFNQIIASPSLPGFTSFNGQVYRDWTSVGIDLSPYDGQTITLDFTTRDCDLGGHYGYAYIDASCGPLELITNYCLGQNDPIEITAPDGFSYSWSPGGDTTQTIIVSTTQAGDTFLCTMTSVVTGCSLTLTAITDPTFYTTGFTFNSCGPVQFTDTSQAFNGSITGWRWDFGDGTGDSIPNPLHTYTEPGLYDVSLVVDNGLGCYSSGDSILVPDPNGQDTSIFTVTINVYHPPIVDFESFEVCMNDSTPFNNLSIFSPDSLNTNTFIWNFGDGSNPVISREVTHLFQNDTTFLVTLVGFTNDSNCVDTITKPVRVLTLPVANFITNDLDSCEPHGYTFLDASQIDTTQDSSYVITDWVWDFGNGIGSDTIQSPYYEYLADGVYDISLKVTASNGCVDSILQNDFVTVYPQPEADFDVDSILYILRPTFEFTDRSTDASLWHWDFGVPTLLNDTSIRISPTYTYQEAGTYNITQIVTDPFGCSDTLVRTIEVASDITKIPNVFTPNGDGVNDAFRVLGPGGPAGEFTYIDNYELRIYSRWGHIVFKSSLPGQNWDGSSPTGKLLPDGTYFWMVSYKGYDGTVQKFEGSVMMFH